MVYSPTVFPSRVDPISNITGFTYRTGSTYQEILMRLSEYMQTTLPDEFNGALGKFFTDFTDALGESQATITANKAEQDAVIASALTALTNSNAAFEDHINGIVDIINNKTGAVDIQTATLTANYTVTVDPLWPENQPVMFALTQDGSGVRTITPGANVKGTVRVESYPYGVTRFTLVPDGTGTWTVVQVPADIDRAVRVQDNRTAHRVKVGARVGMPGGADDPAGAAFFNQVHVLETQMGARFDLASWYAAVNADVTNRFRDEVIPELTAYPDRELMYALEIWRTNDDFLTEFDAQGLVYQYLLSLFTLIKDSGLDDRVNLAPFHEGNGGGGTYPWQMNDTANGNTIEKYAQCFQRVVTLARSLGLRSRFIQWFLTSNGGGADDNRNIAKGYVGDSWADLIGVSYYNRAVDGASETAVGGTLTRFMRHVANMTSRPVWICEAGCYPSTAGHDKGTWYADLIRLAGSGEFPRLEAVCLFMQYGDTTDKRLENAEQRRRVGAAINATRRGGNYGNPADLTRNLIPRSIAVPAKTSDWTVFASAGLVAPELTISNDVPDNVDDINTSLQITKGATGAISTDMRVYRLVKPGDVDFELQKTHTTGFWAKASYDGFKLGFGVRQSGGNLVAGDSRIELSTQWEFYNSPFATNIDPGSYWQFPHMSFGDNDAAGWFRITDMQIARGSHPTPDVNKVLVPRIGTADTTPATVQVNCENRDTWIVTLTGDRLLDAPVGSAYDGQVLTVRVRQDSVGGRVLARSTDPRWFVSSESMTGNLTTVAFSQTLVTMMYFADQDRWGITKVTRMNFT